METLLYNHLAIYNIIYHLQHELALCQAHLFEKENDHAALKDKLSRCEDRMLSNESKEIRLQ